MRSVWKLLKWLLLLIVLVLLAFRLAAWWREGPVPTPADITLIPTRSGRVAAALSGPADGPRIMLLHGSAAWSGFWRDVAAHLAGQGWRVIAVDIPPFGYSDRDPQGRYDRVTQAKRLADVLRATGPGVVVGHSFGAGSAAELALTEPGLVEGLVLVDPALGAIDPPEGRGAIATALGFGPLGQAVTSAVITNPQMTGPLLRSFIARKDAAVPWLDTLREPMRRQGTTKAYAQWMPELLMVNDGALSRKSAALAAIKVPVSLIWGEADTVTPVAQGRALARLVRPRRFVVLPRAGHIPHIETPAEFRAALDEVAGDFRETANGE